MRTFSGCLLVGLCLVACDSGSGGADETAIQVALTGIEDGTIFQRNGSGSTDVSVSGTCGSRVEAVEARVLKAEDGTPVTDWTVVDEAPADGVFKGVIAGVPAGGWYVAELRPGNDPTATATGSDSFGVGVLVACTGQSHIDYWFDPAWGQGAPEADPLTRMYRHAQVLQDGDQWTGWQPVTGMGARVFSRILAEALKMPVGLLDYGVQGAALWQGNTLMDNMGWWLADDSGEFPEADNYAVYREGLAAAGGHIEALLWVQGHTDAAAGETTTRYEQGLTELFDEMRADADDPALPIFISLVTRQTDPPMPGMTSGAEAIQAIRDAEMRVINEDDRAFLGATTIDLPLGDDQIHHTPAGQEIQATRLAQAVLHVLLDEGDFTYHRGPELSGYTVVDGSTIDITLVHRGGDDFTPTSDIKGFEVFGNGVGDIVSVERGDADTIRITVSGDTTGLTGVRYLYGHNPSNQPLDELVTGYAHDNSPLALPVEGGDVPLVP